MNSSMVCYHPYRARWVDETGVFEVCRFCSESRRTSKTGFWPPARRRIERVGGRVEYRDRDGRLFRSVEVD